MVVDILTIPGSFRADDELIPRFSTGDQVRVTNNNPVGHTRVPRYVRGRTGVVTACHGVFLVPDFLPDGTITSPQHLYNVSFRARELWGKDANAADTLRIELWDGHLELG